MTNTNMTTMRIGHGDGFHHSPGFVAALGAALALDTAAGPDRGPGWPASSGPWSVRPRSGRGRRAALEVYEHGELVDVLVESRLGRALLRGARRYGGGARYGGGRATSAWGRLPVGGELPEVAFLGRGPWGRPVPVEVIPIAGRFWFAVTEGAFPRVWLRPAEGGPVERLSVQKAAA